MKDRLTNILNNSHFFNYSIIFKGLTDAFGTESSWISDEANEILKNPEDSKKLEDAVDRLKKGEKVEPLELSNGKTINVGID